MSNLVDHGMNPQEALDRARFRYEGENRVKIEEPDAPAPDAATLGEALTRRGHEVERPPNRMTGFFGGGQAIERLGNGVLVGASDRRKDGLALGYSGGR